MLPMGGHDSEMLQIACKCEIFGGKEGYHSIGGREGGYQTGNRAHILLYNIYIIISIYDI
jgi:hypothetical protein